MSSEKCESTSAGAGVVIVGYFVVVQDVYIGGFKCVMMKTLMVHDLHCPHGV